MDRLGELNLRLLVERDTAIRVLGILREFKWKGKGKGGIKSSHRRKDLEKEIRKGIVTGKQIGRAHV